MIDKETKVEWWNEFHECLKVDDYLDNIFHYIYSRDISNFNPNDIPHNNAKESSQFGTNNPVLLYLNSLDFMTEIRAKEEGREVQPDDDSLVREINLWEQVLVCGIEYYSIKPKNLWDNWKDNDFCNLSFDRKYFDKMIGSLRGVTRRRLVRRIDGESKIDTTESWCFNVTAVKQELGFKVQEAKKWVVDE